MAETALLSRGSWNVNSASTTLEFPLGGSPHVESAITASNARVRHRSPGTISGLYVVVPTNDRSTSVTITSAIGGSAGNQTVTVPAATTGSFEDTTNSDTISAGNDLSYRLTRTAATAGTSLDITSLSVSFAATTDTVARQTLWLAGHGFAFNTGSRYTGIAGYGSTSTIPTGTETEADVEMLHAATLRNGGVLVSTNTCNGDRTLTLRVNAANSALAITIPNATSGTFEDTSNSVAVSLGDLVDWDIGNGGSSGTTTVQWYALDVVTTDNSWVRHSYGSGSGNSTSVGTGVTSYLGVGGFITHNTTEATNQSQARASQTITKLAVKIAAISAGTGNVVFTLRLNGTDTAFSITKAAGSVADWYIATGSVSVTPTDLLSIKVANGTNQTVAIRQAQVLFQGTGTTYVWAAGLDGDAHTIDQSSFFGVWADHIKFNEAWINYVTVSLTNAEIKALRATPKTLVAAPGAGKVLEFVSAVLLLDYGGTNVFTETADNLAIRFNNTTGVIVSEAIETTGFIDQSADTATNAIPKVDAIAAKSGCENLPLVLHNTGDGEIAGNAANNNLMRVKIAYRVWQTGW